jgi:hypothetical protein
LQTGVVIYDLRLAAHRLTLVDSAYGAGIVCVHVADANRIRKDGRHRRAAAGSARRGGELAERPANGQAGAAVNKYCHSRVDATRQGNHVGFFVREIAQSRHTESDTAAQGQRPGEEALLNRPGVALKHLDLRSAARTGSGDELADAIAVQVADRDIHATAEVRIERHETSDKCVSCTVVDPDVRPAGFAGSHDDGGAGYRAHLADGHVHAAAEIDAEGDDVPLHVAGRVKDFNMRAAARTRSRDDAAHAVEHTGGDGDTAAQRPVVGHEVEELGSGGAIKDFNVRATADAGAGDDVGKAVRVQVGDGHVDTADKGRVVGEELAGQLAGRSVIDADHRRRPGAGAAGDDGVGEDHAFQHFERRPYASHGARPEADVTGK